MHTAAASRPFLRPSTRLLPQVHHRRLGALVGAQQLGKVGTHGGGLAPQLRKLPRVTGAAARRPPCLEVRLLCGGAGCQNTVGYQTVRDCSHASISCPPPSARSPSGGGGWRSGGLGNNMAPHLQPAAVRREAHGRIDAVCRLPVFAQEPRNRGGRREGPSQRALRPPGRPHGAAGRSPMSWVVLKLGGGSVNAKATMGQRAFGGGVCRFPPFCPQSAIGGMHK